jgi:hypothetical protein
MQTPTQSLKTLAACRVGLICGGTHLVLSFTLFLYAVLSPSSEIVSLWILFYLLDWPTIFLVDRAINDLQLMIFPVSWFSFTGVENNRLFFASVLGGSLQWFGLGFFVRVLLGWFQRKTDGAGA